MWRHYLYGIHVDEYIDYKSLICVHIKGSPTKKMVGLLTDYCMSVLYHSDKANVVVDTLNSINMGSVSHVEEGKKGLVKDIHRLAQLGVRLEDSPKDSFMVHYKSESSLVV